MESQGQQVHAVRSRSRSNRCLVNEERIKVIEREHNKLDLGCLRTLGRCRLAVAYAVEFICLDCSVGKEDVPCWNLATDARCVSTLTPEDTKFAVYSVQLRGQGL